MAHPIYVSNKTEDLNLSILNMITGIYELKTLTRHISCKFKCKFDGKKCNSNQWCNTNKYRCECKRRHVCEKDYIWNPATCSCENGKYLANIMDDSPITCDEVIESCDKETKTISTNLVKRKQQVKRKNSVFYLHFD